MKVTSGFSVFTSGAPSNDTLDTVVAGVNAGAGQAIGGYQRGASQARGGVEFNYGKEVDGNKGVYASQISAAGQVRNAGSEGAKLRQAAAVIAAVGREISREVGQGMRIRF